MALVRDDGTILADLIHAQLAEHQPFGGIVPEIAARAHLERLDTLVLEAMARAGLGFGDLHGVAATTGPGLIGGLVVGALTAKVVAAVHDLPFLAINHLEAHALTARLTHKLAFPYLLLLASGGHCQFQAVLGVAHYRRLGTTLDDAAGEAFDKVAKMLGLGYPGGPVIERLAVAGDARRFDLPRPLLGQRHCNFSFSGLKTAVRQLILATGPAILEPANLADLCAGFQAAVGDVVVDRLGQALTAFRDLAEGPPTLVVAGGVAANGYLRARLAATAESRGASLAVPPGRLCTDNAVMVAWAAIERLELGLTDPLDAATRPRWPLDPDAEPLLGAGIKGTKA